MRKNLLMLAVILLTALMANAETSQTVTAPLTTTGMRRPSWVVTV